MFIIRSKTTSVVAFLFADAPELTERGLIAPIKAFGVNNETHEVATADPPSVKFIPGKLAHNGAGWSIPSQAAYDAALAALTPAPAIPDSISRRQFYEALWLKGHLTYEEADAAITGTIPATILEFLGLLSSYDEEAAKKAQLLLKGAAEFKRSNYIVPVFGSMYGMSLAQIDELWSFAAVL